MYMLLKSYIRNDYFYLVKGNLTFREPKLTDDHSSHVVLVVNSHAICHCKTHHTKIPCYLNKLFHDDEINSLVQCLHCLTMKLSFVQ